LAEHKAAAEAIVLGRRRLHAIEDDQAIPAAASIGGVDLGDGDYDVATPDLAALEAIGPHPSIEGVVDIASQRRIEHGCGCLGGGR
jgi:hypothetical protein